MKNQITNLITKIISILVIMLMMVNSSLMLVISVAVDAVQKIIDETKINAVYELNMEKYVNYKMGDKQGTLVQTYLKTGIEYQEGQEYVPIDTSNVIINTPKINDKYPESVEVVTKSTKATNGDGSGKDVNYAYNKENGQLQIITENKADDKGNIYTENVAGARDEYQLDFYYDANCYNDKNEKGSLEFKGNVELKLKDDRDIRKNQEISQNFEVAENVSGLVSADVTTSDIYNGYINANIQNNSTYRTQYTENVKIQTSYKEIADEITVNSKNLLVNNKDKENETQEIIYKNTKVNKNEILDKLGQDGYFQIIDKDGNVLATINKDTEADENGNVQIGYDGEKTELNFKFSKPLKLGDINILNTKEIKDTMKDANVTKVETRNTVSCVNNVTEKTKVIDEETKEEKEVENTKQVEIYNYVGTSVAEIKEAKTDVKVTANNTNWTNNVQNDVTFTATLVTSGPEYNLFKNPVIDIKLPNEVEKVVLGDTNLLYSNGLSIKKVSVLDNQTIRVELNGKQTDYMSNSMVEGTNIIIPTTIMLKKDISNIDTSITGTYKNDFNEIKNYDFKKIDVKITSYNDNTKKVIAQAANNEIVVDNKKDTFDNINVNVTTRVGNKILNNNDSIHMGEVIKNVVTITNNSDKEYSNIDVVGNVPEGTTYVELDGEFDYGPENEQERHDLYKKFENMKNVSNRIDAIKANETKTITYLLLVNKDNEQKNINNQIDVTSGTEKIYNDSKNFNIKNANLEVNLYPAEREYLINDSYARLYEVRIKNTGSTKLTNVKADVCLSKYDIFKASEGKVETEEYDSENHKVTYSWNEFGENEEKGVYVRTTIDNMDEDKESYDVPLYVTATCSEDDETYISNEITYLLYFDSIDIVQSSTKEGKELKTGEEVEYEFTIKNSGGKSSVIDFEDRLPSGLVALKAKYECFDGDYTGYKKITKEEDLTLRNKGEENSLLFSTFLPQGETIKVNITAKADYLDKNLDVINFATVTTNSGNVQRIKTSNIIKNTILAYQKTTLPDTEDGDAKDDPNKPNKPQDPDKPGDSDNSGDEVDTKKSSISGTVWIDENKDGIKENNEKRYDGLTVKLFNSETNAIVVNKNGELCKQTTNSNGTYKFDNLEKGKYIVLFEFDDENYEITTYQKENIDKSINSDAVLKSVSIDGREQNVGLTDIIEITGSNVDNIDLGLIKKEKFDFSLKKVITKVNVDENGKKEEKSFNDSQFSKIEIKSKNIGKTNITVEYKFIIKNEGEVTGFLSELIDYIPDGYTINEQSTNTWTKNSKGYIQTTSLSNEEIKPGESKEVTLLLDKKIDNNSMGTITNKAKISKTINAQNEKDVNSDNDSSEAKLIISVSTGIKTSLTIIFIIFITMILMFIILKYGKSRKISLIILFSITLLVSMNIFGTDKASAMYTVDYGGGERWYISDADLRWHIRKNNNGDFEWQLYHDVNNELWCLTPGRTLCDDGDYFNRGGVYFYAENKSYGATYSKDDILGWIKDLNKRPGSKYNGVAVWSEWWKFSTSVGEYNVTQNTSLSYGESSSKIKVGPFKIKSNVNSTVTLTVKSDGKEISNYEVVDSSNNRIGLDLSANSEKTFYLLVSNSTSSLNVKAKVSGNVPVTENGMQMQDFYKYYCPQEKDKTHQTLMLFEPTVKNTSTEKSKNLEWNITIPRGSLEVKKVDSDTGDGISGAKIKVTGPYGFSSEYTMSSSSLTINNLLYGTYKVEETGAPSNYNLTLQIDKTKTVKIDSTDKKSTTIYNKQYGDLTVTKKDKDTGNTSIGEEKLKGIKFKLFVNKNGKKYYLKDTSPTKYSYSDFSVEESGISNAKTFTTDDNAQFSISNLPVYEGQSEIIYNVEEYELPDNLKEYYELKPSADIVKKLQNGKTVYLDVYNKQKYIQISGYVWEDKPTEEGKEDSRNDLYDADRNEPLIPGITVRLKSTMREMVHPNGKGDVNNDGKVDSTDLMQLLYYVSGRDESLSVDAINRGDINNDGRANIQDLILLLRILEDGDVTSLGYGKGDLNSDGVVDLGDINIELNHVSGSQIITEENVKHAADINGDGVVDTRDLMLLVKGVAPSVITVQEEGTLQTTKTGNDGKYEFKKVKIDQLSGYYIEFEYNGLKYQSVAYHNQDNGSKAIEGDTTRDNFNNQYASITGENTKGTTTTTGYSRNATGTVMNNLTYTNGTYASELVGNTGYTVESAANSVKAQNGSTGASIKATTSAANHSLATWSAGVVKLENINLGIYKRQQSDMKIATDLKDIGLTFNGYNHTYTYNKRTAKQGIDIFSELQKWNKTDEQKANESEQYPRNYETSIYKNYVYASASEGDGNGDGKIDDKDKLKMYLNYKIEIKNSSSVYMSANEIARYYNDTLTYSSSYYIDKNGNKHDITWNEKADANKYKQIRTTGLSNVKIEPGSSLTVYLTLQIKDDIIKEFGLGSRIEAIGQGVTEITSYSNYTSDGKYYAAIDKNSAPDNIKLEDINTYEDDTDSAPELKITLKEPKTITGYVFEDKTSDGLLTNQERKGNGKFDNGENTVENVKVELIKQTKGEGAYIYPKAVSELNFNAVPATYTTKANGYYEFVGVVPGEYYIKYTYSNGSVVYKGTNEETNKVANVSTQDYKSTIISPKALRDAYGDTEEDDLGSVNNNDRWYQDTNIETYSTAVDDYATRKGINNTYSTIIASKKVDYDKGVGQQEMTARTLNMNMAIENYNNEVTNMNENRTSLYKNLDFGIAIRPRQSLKLDKKVTYVKLTLSGGDKVAEGNPSNENELKTMNYVTYPKGGKLKIEADDEIIQGATLEIKYTIYVTNNSEKDYNNVAYYRYGTKKDNPVKLSINTIVDYIDQKVPTTYTNVAKSSGGWYVSTDQQIKDLTTKKAYNDVKSRKNILLSDCNKTISIGETMATEPVEASKVMASSEDVDIKNYAEVVKVSNSVGRFYGGIVNSKWVNMTPGNLQVSSDTAIDGSHELDDDGVEVVVVPSTGDNTIIYYILGITCLGIIVCGIVLIKKLVL